MGYETGTNGIGVGQRYGPREVGNVGGLTVNANGEFRYVVEFDANELAAGGAIANQSFTIPESYAKITAVWVEIEEAFDAGDVSVDKDGTTVLSADVALTAVGMLEGSLSVTAADTVLDNTEVVTISTDLVTGTAGRAKVVVEMTRI
jgi:hypothetical protein